MPKITAEQVHATAMRLMAERDAKWRKEQETRCNGNCNVSGPFAVMFGWNCHKCLQKAEETFKKDMGGFTNEIRDLPPAYEGPHTKAQKELINSLPMRSKL